MSPLLLWVHHRWLLGGLRGLLGLMVAVLLGQSWRTIELALSSSPGVSSPGASGLLELQQSLVQL